WSLFSGLQFVGAKNSESCLIKVQCVCESNEAMLVSTFLHQLSVSHAKTQYQYNQIYELIQLFSVWFWFAKVSRVKLLVSQTQPFEA
ncbi:hypothetical protein ABMY36_22045, partial [Vibrio vulnificus]|uniref:hypothetical protein n=1 Tax=Vibrio vulnificus TaxID=672 RepID=UPI00405860DC